MMPAFNAAAAWRREEMFDNVLVRLGVPATQR
jgi:hypothetical protein